MKSEKNKNGGKRARDSGKKEEVRRKIDIDPVDPSTYRLFDNAVFSRAAELRPYDFVADLVRPFIGDSRVIDVKGQFTFNNGPDRYSPTLDILTGMEFENPEVGKVHCWMGIEMQKNAGFSPLRAFVYLSNIVLAHIPKGAGLSRYYPRQDNPFGVFMLLVFCNFHPFDEDGEGVYTFDMREDESNISLGVDAKVIFVDCLSPDLTPKQREAADNLMCARAEDMTIQSYKDALCYARREQTEVERRRLAIMTVEEYDEMLRAEGKAEGIADSVRNLAECGFSNAEIARMLKLPEGEVSDILKK